MLLERISFFVCFSLVVQGLGGFSRDKNPCFLGGFSWPLKKQGKEGQVRSGLWFFKTGSCSSGLRSVPPNTAPTVARPNSIYDMQMDAAVLRDRLPEGTQKPLLGPGSHFLQYRH